MQDQVHKQPLKQDATPVFLESDEAHLRGEGVDDDVGDRKCDLTTGLSVRVQRGKDMEKLEPSGGADVEQENDRLGHVACAVAFPVDCVHQCCCFHFVDVILRELRGFLATTQATCECTECALQQSWQIQAEAQKSPKLSSIDAPPRWTLRRHPVQAQGQRSRQPANRPPAPFTNVCPSLPSTASGRFLTFASPTVALRHELLSNANDEMALSLHFSSHRSHSRVASELNKHGKVIFNGSFNTRRTLASTVC